MLWYVVLSSCLAALLLGGEASAQQGTAPRLCQCNSLCPAVSQDAGSGAGPEKLALLVSPYRLATESEKVYAPHQSFRVTLHIREPINSFAVCVARTAVSGAESSTDRFIRRFLPYHARLRQGCSNVVQQSPTFYRRTFGVLQWRWRAPSANIGCFEFTSCAQLSGGEQNFVQHKVTICPAQYSRFPRPTQDSPASNFAPANIQLLSSASGEVGLTATISLHAVQDNDQVAAQETPVFANDGHYEVRIMGSSNFDQCFVSVETDDGYGQRTDPGLFSKRAIGGSERRWMGHSNVITCSNSKPTNITNVVWTSPAESECVTFRVWHILASNEAVYSERRYCKTEWISVCPNSRSLALPNFQPPLPTDRVDTASLHMETWDNRSQSWTAVEDALSFRPSSIYRVRLTVESTDPGFTTCYATSTGQDVSSRDLDRHGYFLDKPMNSPDKCYLDYSNTVTCHHDNLQPRQSIFLTWMSPSADSPCVLLRFWLGHQGDRRLQEHVHQLCRLTYVELPGLSAARFNAPATFKPQTAPIVYPGPVKTRDDVEISLRGWSEEQGVSNDELMHYWSDQTYLVSVKTAQPYTKCYMMSSPQPVDSPEHSGSFIRRHRSGSETLYTSFKNVIDCAADSSVAGSMESNATRVVWRAPGDASVCVDFVIWLEFAGGMLTKVSKPVCQMKFQLFQNNCPALASLPPTIACRQCPGQGSPYYFLDMLDATLVQRTGCCNGLPHDETNTMCCGDSIQPRLTGQAGLRYQCCGDTEYYDPSVATCCMGNKQDGGSRSHRCCRDQSFSHASIVASGGPGGTVSCCANQPYNTNTKICCSGELHNTWPNTISVDLRCCPGPNIPYNPSSHRCLWCNADRTSPRVVQPLGIPARCCGGLPYNVTEKVCCDQSAEILVDAVSANSGCCAGKAYDQGKARCCSSKIVAAPPGNTVTASWSCCGDTSIFNTRTHACCNGTVYNRLTQRCIVCLRRQHVVENNGAFQCCRDQAYSRLEEICCRGSLKALPSVHLSIGSLPRYECCGEVVYDTAVSTCCSDSRSQLAPGALTPGRRCCGPDKLYDEATQRCVRCTNGQPTIVPSDKTVLCCQQNAFVSGVEICCPDGSVAQISPERPTSAVPRYQCCSQNRAYDARQERCCADGRLLDRALQC
eukprot:scpid16033/ scgid23987/ 